MLPNNTSKRKIKKKKGGGGLNIDPWGTPLTIGAEDEENLLKTTEKVIIFKIRTKPL